MQGHQISWVCLGNNSGAVGRDQVCKNFGFVANLLHICCIWAQILLQISFFIRFSVKNCEFFISNNWFWIKNVPVHHLPKKKKLLQSCCSYGCCNSCMHLLKFHFLYCFGSYSMTVKLSCLKETSYLIQTTGCTMQHTCCSFAAYCKNLLQIMFFVKKEKKFVCN